MKNEAVRCYAAIDIGTNTIRSLVVAVSPDGRYRVLDDERASVRLGEGMSASGKLSKPTIARALKALQRMKVIAEGRGVEKITVVATSALRKATNRDEFVRRVEREVGLRVKVISGAEEARLAFESARSNFDLAGQRVVVADIGGGSTEVIFAAENHIEQIHSLEVGAVTLTEEYLKSDPVRPKEYRALRRFLKHGFDLQFRGRPFEPQVMIVSGGTASALAQLAMAVRRQSYGKVHGYVLTRADIEHLLDTILRRTIAERRALAGLSPDRADIVAAGIAIINELMAELGVNLLMVSARGLRDGLIARIARKATGSRGLGPALTRMAAVEAFAKSCNYEAAHSQHVALLALQIYDRMATALALPEEGRELLHAAALLHDVGYYISYAKHHKHSYHLILHAELPGFTPREVELIANVARYHRRASPRKAHENFERLPKEDQRIVLAIAPMLRIADALDRSHAQAVESVDCRLKDGKAVFRVTSKRDVTPEIWTAREKGALFEKAYVTRVKFRVEKSKAKQVPVLVEAGQAARPRKTAAFSVRRRGSVRDAASASTRASRPPKAESHRDRFARRPPS